MDFKQIVNRAKEVRAMYAKLEKKNYGRSWNNIEIMQGFIGDVGDLAKIIMAKEGIRKKDNIDKKLAHELSDCLWSVLVLADIYSIDLEEVFKKNIDILEDNIKNKLNA